MAKSIFAKGVSIACLVFLLTSGELTELHALPPPIPANYFLMLDGDFNSLSVGNPPDVGIPAGNWTFPPDYAAQGAGETNADEFSVVSDPWNPSDRCLGLHSSSTLAGNQHLANIFLTPVTTNDLGIQVDFDIIVSAGNGGGSVYLGNGGLALRGPEVLWFSNGQIDCVDSSGNLVVITNYFPSGVWQSVRLMVNMTTSRYDFYCGLRENPLSLLATNLPYRNGVQSSLDRITVARFEADPAVDALYDNFSVITLRPKIVQTSPPAVLIPASTFYTNLQAAVIGASPLAFQWYRDGILVPEGNFGTNEVCPAFFDPFGDLFGTYSVVITNAYGSLTNSWGVTQGLMPFFLSSPSPATISVGNMVSFGSKIIGEYYFDYGPTPEVHSTPVPNCSYQWDHDGFPLMDQTNATLVITNANPLDAGNYRLTASNQWAVVASDTAKLNVVPPFNAALTKTSGDENVLIFSTVIGPQYVTEFKSQLTDGFWIPIFTNEGTGAQIVLTNQLIQPAGFYRVHAE